MKMPKGFVAYLLNTPLSRDKLAVLNERPLLAPSEQQAVTRGWSHPFEAEATDALAPIPFVGVERYTVLSYCKWVKKLPPKALKAEVAKRVKELEKTEERKASRKEKQQIKDEILTEQLPNILPVHEQIQGVIDHYNNRLYVLSTSWNKGDEFCSALREELGSLPCMPMSTEENPVSCLKQWMDLGEIPFPITFNDQIEMVGQEQKAKVEGIDIDSNLVLNMLEMGILPKDLCLTAHLSEERDLKMHLSKTYVFSKLYMDASCMEAAMDLDDRANLDDSELEAADRAEFEANALIVLDSIQGAVSLIGKSMGGLIHPMKTEADQ